MDQLPPDFAESLARVLEPGQEERIAEIIGAASQLDDDGLRMFLAKFAEMSDDELDALIAEQAPK